MLLHKLFSRLFTFSWASRFSNFPLKSWWIEGRSKSQTKKTTQLSTLLLALFSPHNSLSICRITKLKKWNFSNEKLSSTKGFSSLSWHTILYDSKVCLFISYFLFRISYHFTFSFCFVLILLFHLLFCLLMNVVFISSALTHQIINCFCN